MRKVLNCAFFLQDGVPSSFPGKALSETSFDCLMFPWLTFQTAFSGRNSEMVLEHLCPQAIENATKISISITN
ncbi:hypothetical protein MSKU15_3211 [Komagataeibacter diospyri]|uniref:hypothetical protein n=1 Tax=Komagataeibacter diospyri TaxID=1932662 RepID=UPI001134A839|nr:hypothetical protein [Komagataeibacter diospyri]GCE91610.1 hypothetical protein MSKU15_3211 [Komagataeibacter diospyri]